MARMIAMNAIAVLLRADKPAAPEIRKVLEQLVTAKVIDDTKYSLSKTDDCESLLKKLQSHEVAINAYLAPASDEEASDEEASDEEASDEEASDEEEFDDATDAPAKVAPASDAPAKVFVERVFELGGMNVVDLNKIAKAAGMKNYSKLKKFELITAICEIEKFDSVACNATIESYEKFNKSKCTELWPLLKEKEVPGVNSRSKKSELVKACVTNL